MSENLQNLRWKFITESEDYFHWSSVLISGKLTIEALHSYVQKTSEDYLKTWPEDERNHLNDFVKDNLKKNGQQLKKLKCKCELCVKVSERLGECRTMQNEPIVLFHPSGDTWWNLLTFYLPKGSKHIDTLEDLDETTLCKILERCLLFDNLQNATEIVGIINSLVHSPKQELSAEKKSVCLTEMIRFLEQIQFVSSAADSALKKIRQYQSTSFYYEGEPSKAYDDLTKAIDIWKTILQRDIELLQSSKEPILENIDLNEVLRIVNEQKSITETLKEADDRCVATINEITAMGAKKGSKALGEGIVGKTVGRLSGAVGARAAGLFKKSNQEAKFKNSPR